MFVNIIFSLFVINLLWFLMSDPVFPLNKYDNYSYYLHNLFRSEKKK